MPRWPWQPPSIGGRAPIYLHRGDAYDNAMYEAFYATM